MAMLGMRYCLLALPPPNSRRRHRARVWRMRPELYLGKVYRFFIDGIELCLTPHIATAVQLCAQIEQMRSLLP